MGLQNKWEIMFKLFSVLILTVRQIKGADTYSTYFGTNADAMDYNQATDSIIFATSAYQLKHVNALTKIVIRTLTTNHFSTIKCVKMSTDGSLVFTGGTDFRFNIIKVSTGAVTCFSDELRGQIKSATIFDDLDKYSFVTNQGFIYFGFISNCSLKYAKVIDHIFNSVDSISSRNEIWVSDSSFSVIYSIVLPAFTTVIYNIPTSKIQSVFYIPSSNYIGVCTQRAFYVLDFAGNIQYTKNSLTVVTRKCTIKQLAANSYAITAISEQQQILISGSTLNPLWNVWKFSITPTFAMSIIQQQYNGGNRYSNNNAQVVNAMAIRVGSNQIYVASIASGFSPLLNYYGDATQPCDSNLYNQLLFCQFCGDNTLLRSNCKACSNAPVCTSCFSLTYINSGTKQCIDCPNNCYACSSATTCTGCVGGYVLINSDCVVQNITACGTSKYDNSYKVTRCVECQIGYYVAQGESCHPCSVKFQNCTECDISKCTKCAPNFFMLNATTGQCELCSKYNQGCASCLNLTFCETCYDDYPYYSTISPTDRVCKGSCGYTCLTCDRAQYDECQSCDVNRTLSGTDCLCNVTGHIEDPVTNECLACRQFLTNCMNCSTIKFCTTCDTGFYFNNISVTQQTCKACNYTCLTCDTYWFKCDSCDTPTNFRVFNTDTFTCDCQILSYFQFNSNVICQLCSDQISDCLACYNQTYCVTCDIGYFIDSTGVGTNKCSPCSLPCTQCFGTNKTCTDCAAGRQLNTTTKTCNCLVGYYSTGTTSCAACNSVLGACQLCDNGTVCIKCYPDNYFFMESGLKKCAICKKTCLTCSTSTTICGTCDPTAHRTMNATTNQCDCETGYTQTDGLCLDCAGTFEHCNSCDLSRCYSCDTGYSLAYGGLKCIDCQTTYPGCILCINGVCAACNPVKNFELSVSKCICSPGYYFKELQCLPYNIGPVVKRVFPAFATYQQLMSNDTIIIKIYFQCQGIYMPSTVEQSVTFTINNVIIEDYTYSQDNTTFYFYYNPLKEFSGAEIVLEFGNKTIFDLDQYPPSDRVFNFRKNIYTNSTYDLSTKFGQIYEQKVIDIIRWIFTVLLLLGSTDVIMYLIFILHFLPAFLLLGLSIPLPLHNILSSMMKINYKSLFILEDLNLEFETYDDFAFIETYGLTKSVIDIKIMDLIVILGAAFFYGVLGPYIHTKFPEGKIKQWCEYKFIFKRYSTVSSTLLCFIPSFLLSAIINFQMQNYSSNISVSIGVSVILISAAGIFVILHSIILLNTQFLENFKNQECYMGSSPLGSRSILYVISILIVIGWGIPLLYGLKLYSLPILILIVLFHITSFRNWDNFPSKILYFIKLFLAISILLFVTAFLVYQISESYDPVSVSALQIVGLSTLVLVIILISLGCFDAIFLIFQSIYRLVRSNSNLVDNLAAEENQAEEEQDDIQNQSNYKVKLPPGYQQFQRQKDAINPKEKLTDKRTHMKNFREKHLRQTGNNMGKIKSSGNLDKKPDIRGNTNYRY